MLRTAAAFIKKDFLQEISYRGAFILKIVSVVFSAAMFYFIAEIFQGSASAFLRPYGGNYFAFLLIGVALLDYHTLSLQVFSASIRDSQLMGTLEIMLLSPRRVSGVVLYSSLWGYIVTSFRFILYLATGIILFGLKLEQANVISALVVLALSIISFAGLGFIIASIIMLLKRADSASLFLGPVAALLGGVAYPVEVLPHWLRQLSVLMPVTHSLNAMRQALLQGYSLIELVPELVVLTVFSMIFLPLGLAGFHLAVQRAKLTGTLGHY
jgi:ABC-2 type transport system permease protein